ncbi:unnamed protein product, partial [Heterosigma akashiwo]
RGGGHEQLHGPHRGGQRAGQQGQRGPHHHPAPPQQAQLPDCWCNRNSLDYKRDHGLDHIIEEQPSSCSSDKIGLPSS